MNKRRGSAIFLILGLVFLVVGIGTDNTAFSYAAIVFVLISLVMSGRWLRRRGK